MNWTLENFRFVFALVLLMHFSYGWAQSDSPDDNRYTNAKLLVDEGKYGLAMQALRPLTNDYDGNRYTKSASFLFAVSAYNDGQKYVAKDMFLQILRKYPDWEKTDEVNLWLANIYLSEGDFQNGINYASFIRNSDIKRDAIELKRGYLRNLSLEELDSLLQIYPSDKAIASNLADKIVDLPIVQQDREYLENIVSVFELDKAAYRVEENLKSTKKDRYNIAIMLPFMLDELKENTKHISNDFVIELYEGILVALSDLRNRGINIKAHLYDTKRDSIATSEIVDLEEIKHMDLIIGPLYPGPVRVISNFAFEQQINMINPLSSNSQITGNNPFAFLFMPSGETIARKSAEYMSVTANNKNALIFHEQNPRDSSLAYAYKKEIESRGFTVCDIQSVAREDGKKIMNVLTNTLKIEFDASEFDIDSLLLEDEVEETLRITEKDYLIIQPDSIGHVFIASNTPSIVASAITGLETRGDTITLLGSERWLDQREISIGALNRINTLLSAPTFIDKSAQKYQALNEIFQQSFNAYPTRNFYIGYEAMMTMGKMLDKLGNLFQFDPGINDFVPGELFSGTLYGSENSNQNVPIVQFVDSELVVANPR
jgi:hypothetical protein